MAQPSLPSASWDQQEPSPVAPEPSPVAPEPSPVVPEPSPVVPWARPQARGPR